MCSHSSKLGFGYIRGGFLRNPLVCRRHPYKKTPCALTQASLDSATWHFFAEGGGFEPPVQLPVRQFSKLLVSATHPSFPALCAIHRRSLSEALPFTKAAAKVLQKMHIRKFFEEKMYFCIKKVRMGCIKRR